jgi:hypothetical protein
MGEPHAFGFTNGLNDNNANATSVRLELQKILQSQGFRSSRRSRDFLRYVVERTLDGHAESLKERSIGIDVFGRAAEYDPSDDATVRVKAGEVRKRLGMYYATEGREDEIRIELPHGTYVPEFTHHLEPQVAPPEEKHTEEVVQPPARRWNWAAPTAVIMALAIIAGTVWWKMRPAGTVVDQFWAPVLRGSAPVLLSAAYVPVYGVDPKMAPERPTRFEDFVLLTDQFVGGGDLLGVTRIAGLLNGLHRQFRVRIGADVTFQDLKAAPTVLIGYSYTRWRDISKELRYFIDAERRPRMVTDNGKPTQWSLPDLPGDRRTKEDYAIVTRVFHPDTQAMLVEVAGITQYGTEGAADLITRPDLLAEGFEGAPKDWQNKNLQLVVHVKVISGTAASPKVVAKYFW